MIFASQNSRFTHFLCFWVALPSSKRLHNYGKSPFFIFKIHCKWPCSIANCSSLPEATFSHYHVPIKSQKQRCVSKICSAPAPRKPVRTVTGTSTRRKKTVLWKCFWQSYSTDPREHYTVKALYQL